MSVAPNAARRPDDHGLKRAADRVDGVSIPSRAHHPAGAAPTSGRWIVPAPLVLLRSAATAEAIGIYLLIGQLVAQQRGPVAVSARDIARLLTGRTEGPQRTRALHALQWLREERWLIADTRGRKHRLIPTWGPTRDRQDRPWRTDQEQYGRPAHVRYVAVSAALITTAIGTLVPRDGVPPLIARTLATPLLNLIDLGTYARQQILSVEPTPQLAHLGDLPRDPAAVEERVATWVVAAAAGTLTRQSGAEVDVITLDAVARAMHQQAITPGAFVADHQTDHQTDHAMDHTSSHGIPINVAHYNAGNGVSKGGDGIISNVDDLMGHDPELNQETDSLPQTDSARMGGGAATADHDSAPEVTAEALINHRRLNHCRRPGGGELAELRDLTRQHGSVLLAWQERALRAGRTTVHTGYYRQCAADAASVGLRAPQAQVCFAPSHDVPHCADAPDAMQAAADPPPSLPRDDAHEAAVTALAVALGEPIRRPERLSAAAPALIAAWTSIAWHDGLRRWRDPAGWVVSEIRRGTHPPSAETLDHWARHLPPGPVDWSQYRCQTNEQADDQIADWCAANHADAPLYSDASSLDDDLMTTGDLLAASLPCAAAALLAHLPVTWHSGGCTLRPRTHADLGAALDLVGVIEDSLADTGGGTVQLDVRSLRPTETPTGGYAVNSSAQPAALDDAPPGVSVSLWSQLPTTARAAVRVGNWRALVRLVGDELAQQLAPPKIQLESVQLSCLSRHRSNRVRR